MLLGQCYNFILVLTVRHFSCANQKVDAWHDFQEYGPQPKPLRNMLQVSPQLSISCCTPPARINRLLALLFVGPIWSYPKWFFPTIDDSCLPPPGGAEPLSAPSVAKAWFGWNNGPECRDHNYWSLELAHRNITCTNHIAITSISTHPNTPTSGLGCKFICGKRLLKILVALHTHNQWSHLGQHEKTTRAHKGWPCWRRRVVLKVPASTREMERVGSLELSQWIKTICI